MHALAALSLDLFSWYKLDQAHTWKPYYITAIHKVILLTHLLQSTVHGHPQMRSFLACTGSIGICRQNFPSGNTRESSEYSRHRTSHVCLHSSVDAREEVLEVCYNWSFQQLLRIFVQFNLLLKRFVTFLKKPSEKRNHFFKTFP